MQRTITITRSSRTDAVFQAATQVMIRENLRSRAEAICYLVKGCAEYADMLRDGLIEANASPRRNRRKK